MTGRGCDPAAPSLAVIGAGIGGCALAARVRQLGWRGPIGLWESGRGPGGRASSRRSRHDPLLRFDHGAPLFSITTTTEPALLAPLLEGGGSSRGQVPWHSSMARVSSSPGPPIRSRRGRSTGAVAAWTSSAGGCWSSAAPTFS
ncbi:NAD(P)-binding protein [Cyanobium sp. BSA11S]|uniref:NAD(P)-binding protein n=1 Tax=Cyanobium sp. BSA11S TaxID=3108224 RepID=UPI003D8165F8